jgi:hypothetical protein
MNIPIVHRKEVSKRDERKRTIKEWKNDRRKIIKYRRKEE